jgi:hypothetical protein
MQQYKTMQKQEKWNATSYTEPGRKKTAHLIDLEHAIGNKKKLRIEYENRMNMFYHKNL